MTVLEARQLLSALPNQLQACQVRILTGDETKAAKLRIGLGEVLELKDQYERMSEQDIEFGVQARLVEDYRLKAECLGKVADLIRDEMLRTEARQK